MNPLFNMIAGAGQGQTPISQGQAGNIPSGDWNALMGRLKANPGEVLKSAGYNVPDEIMNDPRATVMHLMQSGQIGGPMMQRIQPMMQMLGIK